MATVEQMLRSLFALLAGLVDLIVAGLVAIEVWLRGPLQALGLPPKIQVILLIFVAIALGIAALKVFGGVLRLMLVVFLILVIIHLVGTGLDVPG